MTKKSKGKKNATVRDMEAKNYTIPQIKEALRDYNNTLDTSTLNTDETHALQQINEFWNTDQVYHYEKTLDIDKFYDIKEFHEILNGKHNCNSTASIDLKWWDYIDKAMNHRLSLTAKRDLPILAMLNQLELL